MTLLSSLFHFRKKKNCGLNASSGATVPIPHAIESVAHLSKAQERYLQKRVILLGEVINDEVANLMIAQLFYLQNLDPLEPVTLYINSPGGSVEAGLALLDSMAELRSPLHTCCIGRADGIAAHIVAAGSPGNRYSLTTGSMSFRPIWSGTEGKDTDQKKRSEHEIDRLQAILTEHMCRSSGQSKAVVEQDIREGRNFIAQEALQYGLIDQVMDRKSSEPSDENGPDLRPT